MIPQIICIIIFILVLGTSLQPTINNFEDVNLSTTLLPTPVKLQNLNKSDVEIDLKNLNTSKVQSESMDRLTIIIGKFLDSWGPRLAKPEELMMFMHGDILNDHNDQSRVGRLGDKYRWPNATIPYELSADFTDEEIKKIESAMEDFHKHTCIKFVPITGSEVDFLGIERKQNKGCSSSSVGRVGGRQTINLQSPICLSQHGAIIHELMHTVGFYHEHSRVDRDNYVKVNLNNVENNKKGNFDIIKDALLFGEPYDYESVMHYEGWMLRKDNQHPNPLISLTPGVKLGQTIEFSPGDIRRISKMYMCPEEETTTETVEEMT